MIALAMKMLTTIMMMKTITMPVTMTTTPMTTYLVWKSTLQISTLMLSSGSACRVSLQQLFCKDKLHSTQVHAGKK